MYDFNKKFVKYFFCMIFKYDHVFKPYSEILKNMPETLENVHKTQTDPFKHVHK